MFNRLKSAVALVALLAAVCTPAWSQADGAKGLFYEQLENPSDKINTGIQYWIELHRGSEIKHVNNKTPFQSGDRIRFHVKANVNAFAYILLKEGSGGEHAVLFPDKSQHDEPKVTPGKDYPLPATGFLTFDDNPGTERLLLLLSRTPVDAAAYLNDNANERARIVALADGSKDLIPAKMVLGYEPPAETFKPKPAASATGPVSMTVQSVNKPESHIHKAGKITPANRNNKTLQPKRPTEVWQSTLTAAATTLSLTEPPALNGGLVTVVNRDPSAVLALDLSLEHTR